MDIKKEMNIMLGYDVDDLDRMINAVTRVTRLRVIEDEYIDDLNMAGDFLQGLWAEGYFD
jgi:hypothetical protein